MANAPLPENPVELAQFAQLELIARQLVEGLMMGRHRSPFKGSSVEFVEHRDYYPGDEIRHIDWRAYGKTGRYYVKQFEDETNLRAHLLIDVSGSMQYASRTGLQHGFVVRHKFHSRLRGQFLPRTCLRLFPESFEICQKCDRAR